MISEGEQGSDLGGSDRGGGGAGFARGGKRSDARVEDVEEV